MPLYVFCSKKESTFSVFDRIVEKNPQNNVCRLPYLLACTASCAACRICWRAPHTIWLVVCSTSTLHITQCVVCSTNTTYTTQCVACRDRLCALRFVPLAVIVGAHHTLSPVLPFCYLSVRPAFLPFKIILLKNKLLPTYSSRKLTV